MKQSLAVAALACLGLAGCGGTQDITVHGAVELTAWNGEPPAQAWNVEPGTLDSGPFPDLTVTITADDGPGNYAGAPWNSTSTYMACSPATATMITCKFTAQIAGDAQLYQIDLPCCYTGSTSVSSETYTIDQMRAGPVVCIGSGCQG
jgi:hypothetical protein